jgi:pimeloyl-ACP methyl ester carboxylesterase
MSGGGMSSRPCLAFACAHLADERLYAPQLALLGEAFDCRVFVFRDDDTLRGMAEKLLAATPPRFTLIGLSLGGYVAFEVARLQPERLARLALLDTRASADSETQRAGRHADIETVRAGGIDALVP